jgi:hypothetical protein
MPRKKQKRPRLVYDPDDFPGYLTREQVALSLGVTVFEIRRKEQAGILKPALRVGRGQCLFTEDQVLYLKGEKQKVDLARKQRAHSPGAYTAEEAKTVFTLLGEGKSMGEIVLSVGIHPWKVKVIAEMFQELTGCMYVSKKSLDTINSLKGLDGNFPITKEEELVEVLLACDSKGCSMCGRRAKSICKACSPAAAKKMLEEF